MNKGFLKRKKFHPETIKLQNKVVISKFHIHLPQRNLVGVIVWQPWNGGWSWWKVCHRKSSVSGLVLFVAMEDGSYQQLSTEGDVRLDPSLRRKNLLRAEVSVARRDIQVFWPP